ncbi:MAG: redoxin domain-containing protein [Planctomycetes bacterium]|nr:redoxin domain-containing protein [Planctomycetota bacterium]
MVRLTTGLLVLALVTPALRGEEKPAKPEGYEALKKEFDAAQKQFNEKMQALVKEFQAAKTQEEKQAIAKQFQEAQVDNPVHKFGNRFLAFAEKNPKDPNSYVALFQVLQLSGGPKGKSGLWKKAMTSLQKDHVKSEKMSQLAGALGSSRLDDEATVDLLKAIAEHNPNRKAQGKAYKTLANIPKLKDTPEGKKYAEILKEKYADVCPDLSIGATAPEVVNQDLDGKKVKLSDHKGKVVVLDIWATWCGPCRAMIPHERELVKRLRDKPFVLVSISADEKKETLKNFLVDNPMPWTHWWNGQTGGIIEDWDVQAFPTIYVLDAKGVIRYKNVRGEKMDEAVDALLKETEAGAKKFSN